MTAYVQAEAGGTGWEGLEGDRDVAGWLSIKLSEMPS